jgi:Putative prokaryotic signal transducing protein
MTNERDLRDNEPLKMVAVAGPAEAQMIEEMLRNNGIDCTLQGDVVSTPWPTKSDLDEVRVFVKNADAARADELVQAFFTPVGKDELTEGDEELGVDDPDEPSGFTI